MPLSYWWSRLSKLTRFPSSNAVSKSKKSKKVKKTGRKTAAKIPTINIVKAEEDTGGANTSRTASTASTASPTDTGPAKTTTKKSSGKKKKSSSPKTPANNQTDGPSSLPSTSSIAMDPSYRATVCMSLSDYLSDQSLRSNASCKTHACDLLELASSMIYPLVCDNKRCSVQRLSPGNPFYMCECCYKTFCDYCVEGGQVDMHGHEGGSYRPELLEGKGDGRCGDDSSMSGGSAGSKREWFGWDDQKEERRNRKWGFRH